MTSLSIDSSADSDLKRRSRIAVSSAFFMHGLCFASWGSRIPAIQQKLGLSEPALGTVLFALPVGLLVSMPLTSWLVARFGGKKVLTFAVIVYASLLVTLGLASSTLALVALLLAFGVISNMVNVSVNTQAVAVEAIYGRSIMASMHGLWSLAGFVGAAFGTLMIGMNFEPALHFAIVLCAVLILVAMNFRFLLKDRPSTLSKQKVFTLPDKSLLGLGLIAFFSMVCEGAMFDWSGIYFKKVVLAENAWVASGYTAFLSTMAGTRFVADHFVGRLGLPRILQASGLLTTAGLAIAVAFPTLLAAIFGFFLVGAGVSAVVPLVFGAAGKSKHMPPSSAIAAVSTIGFVGFLIGPPLIGWIAGITNLRISFAVIAAMGLGIALLSSQAKDSHV